MKPGVYDCVFFLYFVLFIIISKNLTVIQILCPESLLDIILIVKEPGRDGWVLFFLYAIVNNTGEKNLK